MIPVTHIPNTSYGLTAAVRAMFSAGEQGWWYDPSDFNRYMAPLGPELITNGDFSNGTTGWTLGVGASVSGGVLVTGGAVSGTIATQPATAAVIGKTYKITYTVASVNAANGGVRFRFGGVSGEARTTNGTYSEIIYSSSTGGFEVLRAASPFSFDGTIDNISVKELTALDTATLFQDSAGTTPVTAMEQPVGLQLDLSKGLVLGPETIGAFLTAEYWSVGVVGVTFPGSSIEFDVSPDRCTAPTVFTAGKVYKCQITFARTGNPVLTFDDDGVGGGVGSLTQYSPVGGVISGAPFYFRATTSNRFRLLQAGTGTASVTGFSIKEVAGNHRFQTTSANRPVVSARVNLLTKTEEFNDAAWTKNALTVTANATTAPDGTTTADLAIPTTANAEHYFDTAPISFVSGTEYKISVAAKIGGYRWLRLAFNSSVTPASNRAAWFDLQNGVLGTVQSGVTATIVPDNNGFYRCSISRAATSSATPSQSGFIQITNADNAASSFAGDGTSGIFIWGADLRVTNIGVNLPAYQRVNTSTDYDSTGFPIYIKPNGSNQFMQTNSINFSSTDKMTVWQGVRKLSDAASAMVMELSATLASNNGTMYFTAPESGGATRYAYSSKGTVQSTAPVTSGYTAPTTNVLTGTSDIAGDSSILRINGSQQASNTGDQGTGNYGNYPAYFYMRAGTSLPFNGHDYGSIARGAASTAAQITTGETWINLKTKAYQS